MTPRPGARITALVRLVPSGWIVACALASGCVPGFDRFVLVDPDGADAGPGADAGVDGGGGFDGGPSFDGGPGPDAGPGLDAGPDAGAPRDASTPPCESALLACASSCEALLDALFAEADFAGDTGDFTLRPVEGSGALEAGHLVLGGPHTWLISSQSWAFGNAAACAEVELAFPSAETSSGFLFGLRGGEHGTLLRMRPAAGQLQLVAFEPDLTLLDAAPLAIPTGGATARYQVFSYVNADYAHAEARRLDGDGIAAAHGAYGGAAMALEVELSFVGPGAARARVDRLAVGRLSRAARDALDRW
ncbi:MAG: hypothetical protein KF729_07565 [Sandaracinaceae bacterium]|nr:hypothetical protein [Sandaracinaceae bacterium]